MASKIRFVITILPIILGLSVFVIGFNMRQEATVAITPRAIPVHGLMVFSSISVEFDSLHGAIWIEDVAENVSNVVNTYRVTVTSPLDVGELSEGQVFGFQFPYHVEMAELEEAIAEGDIKAKGWSDNEAEAVLVEVVDRDVHIVNDISIVYLTFVPVTDVTHYEFEFWFHCHGAVIRETFSTYSFYLPIAIMKDNVFEEYFSNLNFSVQPLPFASVASMNTGVWVPSGSRVIDVYPPSSIELIKPSREEDDGYRGERLFTWMLDKSGEKLEPGLQSQALRITFEMQEDLNRHDQLLFDSGLLIGVGISNLIAGGYGVLRYVAETPRRME